MPLMPFENALAICVYPSQTQDREKQDHRENAVEAERAQHEHPREQEHSERVEDDEDEGNEIEAHGELHPCAADRLRAAFIRIELGCKWTPGAQYPRHPERHDRERDDEAEVHDDREIAAHGSNGADLSWRSAAVLFGWVDLEPDPTG